MTKPQLFQAPVLDPLENAVIAEVEQTRATLSYAVRDVPGRWQGLLRRSTFARALRGSNSIEGYHVTVDDAIAVAAGEEPLDATDETRAAVAGYRTAMTYVLHLADDPHFRYSADLIRSLHFMMLQYDLARHPGRWRPGPIYVRDDERGEVVYEGPNAESVPVLMEELVARVTEDAGALPPMVAAALAHLNLVMIHPFSDGNGRMARALQTLVLARTGTLAAPFASIEEYLGRNTARYYEILARVGAGRWNPGRDTRPWIQFCLTAHHAQATTLLRRSREMARLWDALEDEVARRGLPPRLLLALADAAVGFTVRNATYRPIADVSDHTASRDLREAVDAGFLVAVGERRGRHYRASESLRGIRERVREPREFRDPFPG